MISIITFLLVNPVVNISRTLHPDRWAAWLEGVEGVHPCALEWIYPGPDMELLKDLPPLPEDKIRVFKDGEAVSVLKEMVDHFFMHKFAGPFPEHVTHINGDLLQYLPLFCVGKQDSTPLIPKNRVIINAAYQHPWSAEQVNELLNWDFTSDEDFHKFKNSFLMRSLNDNLVGLEVSFSSISDIIKGLYRSKVLWKLDLVKGYRNLIRNPKSFKYTGMWIKIRHPISGKILGFKALDPTVCMGIKNSPAWFEGCIQSFTKATIARCPQLYGGYDNLKLLYSYLDDFMGGSHPGCSSLQSALNHSAHQMAFMKEIGRWLGLRFLNTKMEVPLSQQNLLGITLDTLHNSCSLKAGKASKIAALIDKMLFGDSWLVNDLQKLCGNTIWASMILPRLRAFMTPVIEIQKSFPTSRSGTKETSLKKGIYPHLDMELLRSLEFIKPIFLIDPSVHIYKFLKLLPTHRSVIYSDASGYELDSNNPTPGRLGSLFVYPFAKASTAVCAVSDWKDILSLILREYNTLSSLPYSRFPSNHQEFQIAYLELAALFLTLLEILRLITNANAKKLFKRFFRKTIIFKCDNSNVVTWMNKGRTRFHPWNRLFEFILILEIILECRFITEWVPSREQLADQLTRGMNTVSGCLGKFTYNFPVRKHHISSKRAFSKILAEGLSDTSSVWNVLSSIQAKRDFSESQVSPS